MPITPKPNKHRTSILCSLVLASAAFAPTAMAGDTDPKDMSKSILETPPNSRFHVLINNEFSNEYLTPRGVLVENQGLVWQPIILLFTTLYHDDKAFLSDVGLTTGVWNTVHEHRSGKKLSNLNETDPIAGLTFKFAKQWEFDATYTAFISETDSYDTCHNMSLKLSYSDNWFGDSFAINPSLEYWFEFDNKSTVVFNQTLSNQGWYFSLGINPTYKFKKIPLELSLPSFINIVDAEFYQRFDGSNGGGGVAVISTEFKATVPLTCIPAKYGHWSVYAGVQFDHLDNPGQLDGNQALDATSERLHNLWQFHGGVTVFF